MSYLISLFENFFISISVWFTTISLIYITYFFILLIPIIWFIITYPIVKYQKKENIVPTYFTYKFLVGLSVFSIITYLGIKLFYEKIHLSSLNINDFLVFFWFFVFPIIIIYTVVKYDIIENKESKLMDFHNFFEIVKRVTKYFYTILLIFFLFFFLYFTIKHTINVKTNYQSKLYLITNEFIKPMSFLFRLKEYKETFLVNYLYQRSIQSLRKNDVENLYLKYKLMDQHILEGNSGKYEDFYVTKGVVSQSEANTYIKNILFYLDNFEKYEVYDENLIDETFKTFVNYSYSFLKMKHLYKNTIQNGLNLNENDIYKINKKIVSVHESYLIYKVKNDVLKRPSIDFNLTYKRLLSNIYRGYINLVSYDFKNQSEQFSCQNKNYLEYKKKRDFYFKLKEEKNLYILDIEYYKPDFIIQIEKQCEKGK